MNTTRAGHGQLSAAGRQVEKVLFFDMPGRDARSWRRHYQRGARSQRTRIAMHPFVHERPSIGTGGGARYRSCSSSGLLSFNDAVNAHEGDGNSM